MQDDGKNAKDSMSNFREAYNISALVHVLSRFPMDPIVHVYTYEHIE